MRIESVTAMGFGALHNETLAFGPDLTVVCGRNESAKSTWHAAVYAAICGRSRKRGAGSRAQQEFAARYRPWDGTTWQVGATLLLDDGRAVGMHHDLDGQVNCAATDLATGLDVSSEVIFEGSPDASRWLGMNRDIFSAIACVRQADILSVLGRAGALQEQVESAATHAGTSDPTAAQAIGIIGSFLKENVGKDRANSTKPLRRAIEDMQRCQEALDEARGQHEQYMRLVREAARLADEVAAREADQMQAAAEVSRLTEQQGQAQALAALTAELQTSRQRGVSLAQRLATVDRLRDQGADRKPSVANDTRALTEVASAVTRWRNLADPPVLTGADASTLRAQLEALPEPPVGDQRPDPVVAQALRRYQIAQELAAQKQREEPAMPELSQQGVAAAAVGAVTLRAWAAELDRIARRYPRAAGRARWAGRVARDGRRGCRRHRRDRAGAHRPHSSWRRADRGRLRGRDCGPSPRRCGPISSRPATRAGHSDRETPGRAGADQRGIPSRRIRHAAHARGRGRALGAATLAAGNVGGRIACRGHSRRRSTARVG